MSAKEISMYAVRDAHVVAGFEPVLEWLRCDRLKTTDYQRHLRLAWAKRIAREFDPEKLWPLIVSRRADGDYVLDGQHRLYAIRDVLNWGDQNVPCLVYQGLTLALETKLFNTQAAKGRKAITALDELHSAYVGGDLAATKLVALVERAGLHFDWAGGNSLRSVRAASTLSRQYITLGPTLLYDSLTLLRTTFGDEGRVFQNSVLIGMGGFMVRYHEDAAFDRPDFIRKLGQAGLDAVLQRARAIATAAGVAGTGGGNWVGRGLHAIYNDRRRANSLPEWQDDVRLEQAEKARAQQAADYRRKYPRLVDQVV